MLAIHGGEKTRKTPFPSARRFEGNELQYLKEALEQNSLFYYHGSFVKRFTEKFAGMLGAKYCVAASSCTAAIHTALAALGVGPGDEVIVAPITDMGGIIGVLAQNAVPVFADVDRETCNMTAENIEKVMSPKTKAVIVTHLAGNPCEMDEIAALARQRGVYLVEDCAQAYCAYYKGRLVGTFGDIGCFSTNEFKHISTGDGGMCVMNDENLYRKALLFTDKGYNREAKTLEEMRAVDQLCANYRMTELQGAVGLAQLEKLHSVCSSFTALGNELTRQLSGIDGLYPPKVMEHNICSYWFYLIRLDLQKYPCGIDRFAEALCAEGIHAAAGYIRNCVYEYDLFKNQSVYRGTDCPFGCKNYPSQPIQYKRGLCPNAELALDECIYFKLNEAYGMDDIFSIAEAIRKVCAHKDAL